MLLRFSAFGAKHLLQLLAVAGVAGNMGGKLGF